MDEENIMVERYDASEEGSETSCVPETSQSLTETRGTEDTPTSSKTVTGNKVMEESKKKTFASFFQDKRNPNKGIPLCKMENQQGFVIIDPDDVTDVIETWGYSLVGYVAWGFPSLDAINKMRATWKVLNKYYIHKEEDQQSILEGGPYMIYGRPLILKHMLPLLEFGPYTNTVIPM